MKVFGFAGWSGSGKTTLIEQLIPRFVLQGMSVSLIKHAHHQFDIDRPGKDSYRHRHAGCTEVMVTSDVRWALMHELRGEAEHTLGEIEEIATLQASGRVLARPQHSDINVPALDNSSMDGYAVRAAECASGEARLPVSQRIPAGTIPGPLAVGTAGRVFPGAPIPPGADAAVMQELCTVEGDQVVIRHKPKAGDWIRRVGEDIRAGSRILEAGGKLGPQDAGLAASAGIATPPG